MRYDKGYFEEQQLGKSYDLKLLKRLSPYAKPYRWLVTASILLVILITVLDLAIPYLTKIAIDQYIVPKSEPIRILKKAKAQSSSRYLKVDLSQPEIASIVHNHPHLFEQGTQTATISYNDLSKLNRQELSVLRRTDIVGIGKISLVFLLIILLNFGLNFVQKIIMEYTGHMMMNDLRLKLFDHIQHLAISFFTRNPVGRLVTRLTNDIQNMHELFTSVISLVFKDFLLLVGIAVVLLIMNWKMALISFLILPFVLYTSLRFSGHVRDVFRVLRIKIAEINTKFSESIDGMKVIQSFGKEDVAFKAFARLNHENYLAGMRQIHVLAIFMPLIEVFGVVTVAVLIFYGGQSVLADSISLGVLVAFISYMRMFFRPIRDLAEKYNILQNAMASAERLFLILDTDDGIETGPTRQQPHKTGLQQQSLSKITNLVFKDVSFAYMPSEPVLKNISLQVHTGETLAVVGPTGSGKTSFINLITRFYDPDSGGIFINGCDIRSLPVSELRSRMALVTQDPFLFTDTIMANIWWRNTGLTDKEIKRVLAASNCSAFIERLPKGIHHVLESGGASISSGERQLISIARAFAKNPELILLDEATSYVDSQTEKAIQDALATLMKGRTAVVVAHRLSTIRHADRIVVMVKGRIIETGTHAALMQAQGFYFQLNHLQTCIGLDCRQMT